MILRIDHTSIAVRDLAKAKSFFVDILGGREIYRATLENQGFRWTTLELGSSCLLELIDPQGPEGFLSRFLNDHGEGVHHLTLQVDDARRTRDLLEEKGVPTFGFGEELPGWKEFFVHPRHAFGTLLQFAEFDPLAWIEPGYVPRAYQDFVPSEPGEPRVSDLGHGEEAAVEIAVGDTAIRVQRNYLASLIRRLQEFEATEPI